MLVKEGITADNADDYEVRIGGVDGGYLTYSISAEEAEEIIYGDLNNNGGIDIGDPVWLLKKVATPSISTPVEDAGKNATTYGDVNNNGGIDVGDPVWLLKKVATPSILMPIEEAK